MKNKIIISLLVLFVMGLSETAFAKTVTFTREYTYQASEADSKLSCRAILLEQVKRLLLEELGTYLESVTEMKNLELTKDQITTQNQRFFANMKFSIVKAYRLNLQAYTDYVKISNNLSV